VGKQPVMHRPEFPLFSGTIRCHRSLKCLRVTTFQGKVAEEKLYLASEDIILLDLGKSLTVETSAKGALVIGKLDQTNSRILIAFEKSVINCDYRLAESRLGEHEE
jgi:hypothetical protein